MSTPGLRLRTVFSLLLAVGLFGCASVPPPEVPVVASSEDASRLAGTWRGIYSSALSRRSGTIRFVLDAGNATDTAFGDVLMFPASQRLDAHPRARPGPFGLPPQHLTIRIVSLEGNRVLGALAPYRDPECGCLVSTVFLGNLSGNVIEGTYLSEGSQFHLGHSGQWRVTRRIEASVEADPAFGEHGPDSE